MVQEFEEEERAAPNLAFFATFRPNGREFDPALDLIELQLILPVSRETTGSWVQGSS